MPISEEEDLVMGSTTGTEPPASTPPRRSTAFKWILGYLWPWNALYTGIALLTWLYLTPDLARMKHFAPDWVGLIFLRNLGLIILYVGAWHLPLYRRRTQGTQYKYNARWLTTENSAFAFQDQVLDNLFWTLCSAVPIWTAYEVATFWCQANGLIPTINFWAHPLYCTLVLLSIPAFRSLHFYAIHRWIHWPPLYRTIHYLHHKNVNPGPWSGLAMHPVEHLLYFSAVLLHWVIPSHPAHVLVHLQQLALSPCTGHSGFDKVLLGTRASLDTHGYTHYLHHRYFEVNYGGELIPVDRWMGTFHDGSAEAQAAMRQRLQRRRHKGSPA